MKIFKSAVKNVIITPVLVPDTKDRNWDIITSEEIQKTAYEFIKNLDKKTINIDHESWTDVEWASFVESYIICKDTDFWDWEIIKKWTWVIWIKLPEDIYKQALNWDFWAVSMEWEWCVEKI